MNYQTHYDKLIERARNRQPLEFYFEFYHDVPLCIGGADDLLNIVELLPEEHRIAHLLLAKIYPHNSDLGYAAFLMTKIERYRGRSKNRQYAWVRCAAVEASRERGREQMLKLWEDPEFAAACSTRMQELHKDPVYARTRDRQASKTFRKLWDDPVFAAACAERGRKTLLELWQGPEFAASVSERARGQMLRLWQDPEFVKSQAKRSAKQGRKNFLKLWDNLEFAASVSERARDQMVGIMARS